MHQTCYGKHVFVHQWSSVISVHLLNLAGCSSTGFLRYQSSNMFFVIHVTTVSTIFYILFINIFLGSRSQSIFSKPVLLSSFSFKVNNHTRQQHGHWNPPKTTLQKVVKIYTGEAYKNISTNIKTPWSTNKQCPSLRSRKCKPQSV